MIKFLIHIISLVTVLGHGIFWSPKSRSQLAQLSGWEQDSTKIISEPMPPVAEGRDYPGGRPFAEPGKSKSNVGPCGMKTYDQKTNWNKPDRKHGWGNITGNYKAGETIEIEWCVSNIADHGGIYSYRLCTDDKLVAKFIDENYVPNEKDMDEMEDCFKKGILACTDVEGQDCPIHPDCKDDWGCQKSTSWFNCGPKDSGRCQSKGSEKCFCHQAEGTILRDRIKLPENYRSNHTLLGFRWDCEDTPQLWMQCADISIM